MSGPARLPTDLYGASRWHAARVARREVRALRESGTAVVVFRPGRAEQEAIGNNFMARDRVDQIVQEAFLGAGSFAAKPEIRRLLATHRRAASPLSGVVPSAASAGQRTRPLLTSVSVAPS